MALEGGMRVATIVVLTMLLAGGTGVYRAGKNFIRFGPGAAPHQYTELRGAEPKLPGQSVYITGFTPFDHTITLEGGV